MKKILVAFLSCIVIISCSGRKEYNDEEYKQKQVDYEKKKAELNKNKGEFFKANKEKLMALAEIFVSLTDTARSFEKTPSDSTYYKDDVAMNAINFSVQSYGLPEKQDQREVKVVFLHRMVKESLKEIMQDPLKGLIACYNSKNDVSCLKMKTEELQTILDLEYAFIVDDIIKIDPVLKNSQEFESGLYLGRVICYDLVNNKPLLAFAAAAGNSSEIQSFTGSAEFELKRDFTANIKKELVAACVKHFFFK